MTWFIGNTIWFMDSQLSYWIFKYVNILVRARKRGAPMGGHPVTFLMILWIFIFPNLTMILLNLQIVEEVCFAFLNCHTDFLKCHIDFSNYRADFLNYHTNLWIIVLRMRLVQNEAKLCLWNNSRYCNFQ